MGSVQNDKHNLVNAQSPIAQPIVSSGVRPSSVSLWSVSGVALGGFLLLVFDASLFAGAGWPLLFGQVLLIGLIDATLSFCAALYHNRIFSFEVGFSAPFLLLAVSNTLAIFYSLVEVRVVLFSWEFALALFFLGYAAALTGRTFKRARHGRGL